MWEYRARAVKILDGDSVVLAIDCGFFICSTQTCRLFGIDTPELVGSERDLATQATNRLRGMLQTFSTADEALDPWPLLVQTRKDKDDKFGRLLVTIWLKRDLPSIWTSSANYRMIEEGFAKAYDGGKR